MSPPDALPAPVGREAPSTEPRDDLSRVSNPSSDEHEVTKMRCPVCGDTDLLMTDRQGVEIDYCPSCRGVWLDRGELDKIVERSNEMVRSGGSASRDDTRDDHSGHDTGAKKKKGGFLGDLLGGLGGD